MAVQLLPQVRQQFVNANGVPFSGGQLFSYVAGTTTPLVTYSDNAGSVPNTNPIVLDASGEADVWITPGVSYKFVLEDVNSVVQWTRDNISIQAVASGSAAPSVTGSRGTPQQITAAGGIAFTGSSYFNIWFVKGNGGPVTVTANPQIAVGTLVGQRLLVIACDNTNTLILANGTGLDLDGTWLGNNGACLDLVWDGSNWVETGNSVR